MINKYLKNAGYKETSNNDLQDKQFTLISANYEISDYSTFKSVKTDYVEVYNLFLKDYDSLKFKTKLENILTDALNNGVDVFGGVSVSVESQENGYLINIEITMKGK